MGSDGYFAGYTEIAKGASNLYNSVFKGEGPGAPAVTPPTAVATPDNSQDAETAAAAAQRRAKGADGTILTKQNMAGGGGGVGGAGGLLSSGSAISQRMLLGS